MNESSGGVKTGLMRYCRRISPVHAAFFGSLLLSLIAIQTNGTLNRDGMLYVDTARIFLQDGFVAAKANFNWPFLPILIAGASRLTGLGLETAGNLMNALFLAGTMALMAACARRQYPEAVWPICLTLLALPGLNHYRDELLREYGCWFFALLSFWLALLWSVKPRWRMALAAQLALGVSALFRPEALAFFPALVLWQFFAAPQGERWRRLLMLGGLPLLGLAVFLALYLDGQFEAASRLSSEVGRFSLAGFDGKAEALAAALIPYARDQARTILLFGSLAIIPLKFIKQMGIFVVPLLFLLCSPSLRTVIARWQIFAWAFLVHLLVLAVFVVDLQFLAGRYVIVLHLLAAPLIGFGWWLLMQRWPRWRPLMVTLVVLLMLSNVVSLNPKKTHFADAGAWLAANVSEPSRVYIESPRAAYYAGWSFTKVQRELLDRAALKDAFAQGRYDLAVLEIFSGDVAIEPWLGAAGLKEIRRFPYRKGEAVIVVEPLSGPFQDKASKTERMERKTGSIE